VEKRITPGQLTQTRWFTREVECWHNLCSGHETTRYQWYKASRKA
jgi:hypothetical protein